MSETNLTTTNAPVARQSPLTDAEVARMAYIVANAPLPMTADAIDGPLVAIGLIDTIETENRDREASYSRLTDFAKDCIDDNGAFRIPQFGDFYPCEPEVEAELSRRGGDPIPSVTVSEYDKPESPNTKFLLRRDKNGTSVLIGHNNRHLSGLWANISPNGDGRFYVECGVEGNRYVSDSAFRYDREGTIPDVYATEPEAVVGACRMLCTYLDSLRGDVDDMTGDLERIAEAMAPKVEVAK